MQKKKGNISIYIPEANKEVKRATRMGKTIAHLPT